MKLFYSYDTSIENAYIITIKGNELSEKYSKICQDSCEKVGMPYKVWDAYDGTGPEIIEPEHSKGDSVMEMIKVTNHFLTRAEVACVLSHLSLWVHCAKIDKPIVILEHDAYVVKKISQLDSFNSIVFLGGVEWAEQNWKIYPIPPHASKGPNYHFICRAHAYAIDPYVAKNLISHVLQLGIHTSADCMMRADIFNVTHQGLHAYDKLFHHKDTTITERPEDWNQVIFNPDLSH